MEVNYIVHEPVKKSLILDLHGFIDYINELDVDYKPEYVRAYFMSWLIDENPDKEYNELKAIKEAINYYEVEKEINKILDEEDYE